MFVVGVYVTSRYRNYPELKVTLDEALKKYIPTGKPNALCTGSSKSNESGNGLVRRYAFENGIPCRVFETQWSNNIPTKPGKKNTAGVRANAMIIRNSNACVLFWTPTAIAKWDFMSGGCYNFRKMCGKMGRELIEVKVDIYKQPEQEMDDERITTLPDRGGDGAVGASEIGAVSPRGGGDALSYSGGIPSSTLSAPSAGASRLQPPSMLGDVGGDSATPAELGSSQSMQSVSVPNSSGISDIPIDINGDGTPDTSIPAIDTTGDGVPDSQLTPVDVDNNGTIDKVELTPLAQGGQNAPSATPPQPQQVAAQTPQPQPQPQPQAQAPSAPSAQTMEEKDVQQQQQ